jgi:hypothetical protein
VIPGLGKRQLDQLTPEDIDVFYAALLKGGRQVQILPPPPTKSQFRGPFPKDRRGPLWHLEADLLHQFLHSGVERDVEDRY